MNVVSQDTIFTGRVIMAKDATGKDIDISGSFANKTGDERINFKVANGIDLKDAVNLEQLNEVKDLAFDYVGDTEPTDAIEGDIWLDTSIKSNCIIKIKRLTPTGAQWQDCLGGLKTDVNIVLEGFEATLKQYKDEIDKAFSNTDGKYALKYGDLTIPFKVADAVAEGEAVTLRQLLQATLDKANVNNIYDRKTIDGLINGLIPKGSLIGPFNIKGKLTNNELQALPIPLNGDIYFVTDENIWAVRIEGEWLKEQLFNDNKYFTQQQILALLETKADNTTLNNTIIEIEQIKQQIGTIDEAEVNKLIQAAIVNMVITDGGQTFTNPIKYDNSVTIDSSTDGKTLVHKEYVDSVVVGGVVPSDVYTKQEVDNLLKQYARIDDSVTNEDLNNALKNLFRNRADLVWKGYKANLGEIEAIQNPEVGDTYAIVSVTKTTPVYMFDGFKWIALSIEEYSKGTTTIVDRPALVPSDNPGKGSNMYKIAIPTGGLIQVLGVYVENTPNSSLDSVNVDTIIKDDNLVVYTNADAISKLIYITDKGDNNLIDMSNLAKLNMDNHYHNENTYDLPPIILGDATDDNHALKLGKGKELFAQLGADNTLIGANTFSGAVTCNNLKVTKDATEAEEAVNLRTLQTKIGEIDYSNFVKKNEANVFTEKQSGVDGTEDANFVTLRQLKTKVGLTGDETIAGNKTFSNPVAIPNASADNHSLPLGQADGRYSKLLTQELELTVGTGSETSTHFNTLEKAFIKASTYSGAFKVKVKIKSGTTINEIFSFNGSNCPTISLEAESSEVNVANLQANLSYVKLEINCLFNNTGNLVFSIIGSHVMVYSGGFKNATVISITSSYFWINRTSTTLSIISSGVGTALTIYLSTIEVNIDIDITVSGSGGKWGDIQISSCIGYIKGLNITDGYTGGVYLINILNSILTIGTLKTTIGNSGVRHILGLGNTKLRADSFIVEGTGDVSTSYLYVTSSILSFSRKTIKARPLANIQAGVVQATDGSFVSNI
ncbi:hypothetical protein ACSM7Z_001728 [Campylobacter jejuni]